MNDFKELYFILPISEHLARKKKKALFLAKKTEASVVIDNYEQAFINCLPYINCVEKLDTTANYQD